MKVYALTGGIASGKSTAAALFEEEGIPLLDADRVAHEAIAPGGVAETGVIESFGDAILTDGKIDRAKLGAVVFRDPDALRRLNGLVHPAVRLEIAKRIAAHAEAGKDRVIVEAALHAENGEMPPGMEGLILVTCPHEERVRRLVEGRGMDREEAERRIAAQTPPEKKRKLARWVIDNSGTPGELKRQVVAVAGELKNGQDSSQVPGL